MRLFQCNSCVDQLQIPLTIQNCLKIRLNCDTLSLRRGQSMSILATIINGMLHCTIKYNKATLHSLFLLSNFQLPWQQPFGILTTT